MTAPEPVAALDTAATRHLCAAAYLDESFHRESLREAFYQANRVVAPSYGFRLIPVLWHCLRARNLVITRDAIIVVLVLPTVCLASTATLILVAYLLQLFLAVTLGRMILDTVRRVRSTDPGQLSTLLTRGVWLLVGTLVLSGVWVLIWFIVFAAAFSDGGGVVAVGFGLGALLVLAVTGLSVGEQLWRQRQVAAFVPGSRATDPPRSARFDEIFQQQQGNTVVYSGYHPFVGSGAVIDTWGFAQRLVRPDPGIGGPAGEAQRESILNAGAVHTGSGTMVVWTAIGAQAPPAAAPRSGAPA